MQMTLAHDMFYLGLPVAEKILRPIAVYAFLIVVLRLGGKRELAQLNPFDLVVLLTISNTVQNAIIGEDNSVTGGMIGAATLLFVNHVVVRYLYAHRTFDRFVEGDPAVLITHGVVDESALRREAITRAALSSAAHKQGFSTLHEIERATLEPSGSLAFVGKQPAAETERHKEVLARLDRIDRQLAALHG
jgi:uncharacterized membrane protein YcaP (DUF421 family)